MPTPNAHDERGASSASQRSEDAAAALLADPREQDFVGRRDLTRWPSALGRSLADLAVRARHRLFPHQIWAITLLIGLALTAALTIAVAGTYDSVVEGDGVTGVDQPALHLAMAHRGAALNTAVTAYTDIGGPVGMPVLAALTAAGLALLWRRWTPVTLIVTTMLGSLALTVAGKVLVGRPRPPLADAVPPYEHSFSFPSGHTLNATAFAGIVAYLLLRRLRQRWARRSVMVLACAFPLAIGLSRVYLGHHWFTDVLVAWALGGAWLSAVITSHRLYLTVHRSRDGRPGHGLRLAAATPDDHDGAA